MPKPLYTERDWIPALNVVDQHMKHSFKVGLSDGKDILLKIAEDGKSMHVVVSGIRVPHSAELRFINPELTFKVDIRNFENSKVGELFLDDEFLDSQEEIKIVQLILELEDY